MQQACARLGQFIGFSDEHFLLVANVRHLTTHFISPQFHLVLDDLFKTVNEFGVFCGTVEPFYDEPLQLNCELFSEEELDEAGNIIYQSLLYMKPGLMKPDAAKATKIVFTNVAVMRTLCATAVVLCN